MRHFSLSASNVFSLWLAFSIFTAMCLGVDLLVFILPGFFYILGFIEFGKCSLLFLWISSCSFSPPCLLDSQQAYVGALTSTLHFPEAEFILLYPFSLCSAVCLLSTGIYGQVYGFCLLTTQTYCSSTLVAT